MPLYRQLDMTDQFHFTACPRSPEQFPAYIAASIKLTMLIATLHDAMHCLQAPKAYAKKTGGNSTAEDLQNQVETILPSHLEETKNFMQERDTKIRISKVIADPWFNAREADGKLDPNKELATICDAAGLPRKLKLEDMLITMPRPQNNTDPKCYAVEGNNGRGEVNNLLAFNETFGPVLEIIVIPLENNSTPTVGVRVPSYQTETLDGEAWTPTTPLRNYTLKGKPEVSVAYRTGDLSRIGIEELQKQPHREDTWITVITGTESNSILHEKVQMAPDPKTHAAIVEAGGEPRCSRD